MGESAGGGSIMHQITAYGGLKGKAPFQQAIPQSPAFQPLPSNAQQETIFTTVLGYASFVSNTSVTSLAQLRTLPTAVLQLVNAVTVGLSSYGTYTFGPAVDGNFVPALPGVLLLHGQFDHDVKVMVGHNSNEGYLFTSPFITNNTQFTAYIHTLAPAATNSAVTYIDSVLYPPVF